MNEVIPVVLGALLGAMIGRFSGTVRLALGLCAIMLGGASATLRSGEFLQSWTYVLIDSSLVAFGLALGIATAHRISPWRRPRRRSRPG